MMRTMVFGISLLAVATASVADDATPLTAAVVDAKKPASRPAAPERTPASQANAEDVGVKPEGPPAIANPPGDVQMSGMSVLGNDDSPQSLVLVPWKGSQLGDAPGLSKMLDDSTQPVDKDVFMRELAYYQIKSDSK